MAVVRHSFPDDDAETKLRIRLRVVRIVSDIEKLASCSLIVVTQGLEKVARDYLQRCRKYNYAPAPAPPRTNHSVRTSGHVPPDLHPRDATEETACV